MSNDPVHLARPSGMWWTGRRKWEFQRHAVILSPRNKRTNPSDWAAVRSSCVTMVRGDACQDVCVRARARACACPWIYNVMMRNNVLPLLVCAPRTRRLTYFFGFGSNKLELQINSWCERLLFPSREEGVKVWLEFCTHTYLSQDNTFLDSVAFQRLSYWKYVMTEMQGLFV